VIHATLDEVISLERRLLDPAVRADRDELERLLHEDFVEFGAAGTRWDRESIIDALTTDPGRPADMTDVAVRAVAENVVLVTYVATRPTPERAAAYRSSLWVRSGGVWRVVFHQGTVVAG